jgi:hypothetical protein
MYPLLTALVAAVLLMAACLSPVSLMPKHWGQLLSDQRGLMFQRINRSDAEQIFAAVYNVTGATQTAGYALVLDTSTFDGLRVTKPATATLSLFMGVANKDIADSSYGIAQIYGYRASAFVTNDTSQAIAAGDILIPVNAQSYLTRSAASDGKSGFAIAGQSFATATTPAAANKNVFLRGL